jgi:uncharacterized hydrophobic protein (TIGR00341 family)
MKWLEVRVTKEEADKVEAVLVTAELPYSRYEVHTESGPAVTFSLPVPDEYVDRTVENVLDQIDTRVKTNIVVVKQVSAAISPALDRLNEKARAEGGATSPVESVVQHLAKYRRPSLNLAVLTALASLVALTGLFLNNVAVIIGAMLLSPLMGPINGVSLDATLGKLRYAAEGEASVLGLAAMSIGVSAAVTFVVAHIVPLRLTSQILAQTSTSLLGVGVALLLGLAAGLAVITDLPESLVGVAVAVALVPPMAATGIMLALGRLDLFWAALLVVLTNIFGLNVGGIAVLFSKGVSPRKYYEKAKARTFSMYALAAFLVIVFVLAALVSVVPKG